MTSKVYLLNKDIESLKQIKQNKSKHNLFTHTNTLKMVEATPEQL